jgi:hypothetical protein
MYMAKVHEYLGLSRPPGETSITSAQRRRALYVAVLVGAAVLILLLLVLL